MEDYNRMVIELYKKSFADYVNNNPVNVDEILEAQQAISNAITKATVQGIETDALERLKADVDYLKYKIL